MQEIERGFKKLINTKRQERKLHEILADELFQYYFDKYDFIPQFKFKNVDFSFYFYKLKCAVLFGNSGHEYDLNFLSKHKLTIYRVDAFDIEQLLVAIAQIKTNFKIKTTYSKGKKSKKVFHCKNNLEQKNTAKIILRKSNDCALG